MKEKKSEVITIRVTPTTKKRIEMEAEKREWSASKLAEKILSTWVEQEENQNIKFIIQNNQNININGG